MNTYLSGSYSGLDGLFSDTPFFSEPDIQGRALTQNSVGNAARYASDDHLYSFVHFTTPRQGDYTAFPYSLLENTTVGQIPTQIQGNAQRLRTHHVHPSSQYDDVLPDTYNSSPQRFPVDENLRLGLYPQLEGSAVQEQNIGSTLKYYRSPYAASALSRRVGSVPGASLFGKAALLSASDQSNLRGKMLLKLQKSNASSRKMRIVRPSLLLPDIDPSSITLPYPLSTIKSRFPSPQNPLLQNSVDIPLLFELISLEVESELEIPDDVLQVISVVGSSNVSPSKSITKSDNTSSYTKSNGGNRFLEASYCPYARYLSPFLLDSIRNIFGQEIYEQLKNAFLIAEDIELERMRKKEKMFLGQYANRYVPYRYRSRWRDGRESEFDHLDGNYIPLTEAMEVTLATIDSGLPEDESTSSIVEDLKINQLKDLYRKSFRRGSTEIWTENLTTPGTICSGTVIKDVTSGSSVAATSFLTTSQVNTKVEVQATPTKHTNSVLPTPDSKISETYFDTPLSSPNKPNQYETIHETKSDDILPLIPLRSQDSFFRTQVTTGGRSVKKEVDFNTITPFCAATVSFRDPFQSLRAIQSPTLSVLDYDPSSEFRKERQIRRDLLSLQNRASSSDQTDNSTAARSKSSLLLSQPTDNMSGDEKNRLSMRGKNSNVRFLSIPLTDQNPRSKGTEKRDEKAEKGNAKEASTLQGSSTQEVYPTPDYEKLTMKSHGIVPYSLSTYYLYYVPEVKPLKLSMDGTFKESYELEKRFLFQKRQLRQRQQQVAATSTGLSFDLETPSGANNSYVKLNVPPDDEDASISGGGSSLRQSILATSQLPSPSDTRVVTNTSKSASTANIASILAPPASSPLWSLFFYGLCAQRPKKHLSSLSTLYRVFHAWKGYTHRRKRQRMIEEDAEKLVVRQSARRLLYLLRMCVYKTRIQRVMNVARAVNAWYRCTKLALTIEEEVAHRFQKDQFAKKALTCLTYWRAHTQSQLAWREFCSVLYRRLSLAFKRRVFSHWKGVARGMTRGYYSWPYGGQDVQYYPTRSPNSNSSTMTHQLHNSVSRPSNFLSQDISIANPLAVAGVSNFSQPSVEPPYRSILPLAPSAPRHAYEPLSLLGPSSGDTFLRMHDSFYSRFQRR